MIGKTRPPAPGPARGVLNQRLDPQRFQHQRQAPCEALAPWVEHFWHVGWDLEGLPEQQQETLPHPNVQLVVEGGEARLWGVHGGRFVKRLAGKGWVFGIKFRAAAFQPFWGQAVSGLANRSMAAEEVFGAAAQALTSWREWPGMETLAAQAEALLLARLPAPDPQVQALGDLVALIAQRPDWTSVEQLAEHSGHSPRQLQRLFSHYVGASPKWVIARYRLHEALALLQSGEARPDAELALRLGYFDQAHFIRDFRRLVGRPPAAYLKTMA
ncbi:helix-turn-helix transcriptional regulator [Pelomonas sp. V22]|uniref:helix-turn-helix transcriptional regulator n=1 Tax=Pelomonas sp. V22 TaxID=2822139 RepID=UPI0024A8E0BF|nr:helix-turn-helix transcriptional regulator [Pelomonas sp. V22]MDI4634748.1 helix-turn-helix transcriptional regulator [Pelomonas sp. V22]